MWMVLVPCAHDLREDNTSDAKEYMHETLKYIQKVYAVPFFKEHLLNFKRTDTSNLDALVFKQPMTMQRWNNACMDLTKVTVVDSVTI